MRAAIPVLIGLLGLNTVGADDLSDRLRARVESLDEPGAAVVGPFRITWVEPIAAAYRETGFAPFWSDRERWQALVEGIESARDHGLNPDDYRVAELRRRSVATSPGEAVDRELLATDAFLTLVSHLLAGKVNPTRLYPDWESSPRSLDLKPLLLAVATGPPPGAILDSVLPQYAEYRALQARFLELQSLPPTPGAVDDGPALKPGQEDVRVAGVRARLEWLGEMDAEEVDDPALFDPTLEAVVKRFQHRHGLDADGVVGRQTLAMLNMSAQARRDRIRVNLERWRWLPESLGTRHIRVNIADYSLIYQSPGEDSLSMRAVAGRPYRKTPVFSSTVNYLVFNPSWSVPHRLAAVDLLPELQRDPAAVVARGFSVLRGWGGEQESFDPMAIDWSEYSRRHFPFRLRQAPGPQNALGRVKFMLPNAYDVFLHDTPTRGAFAQSMRALSSGCIRLEEPLLLAEHLLAGQSDDPRKLIEAALAGGNEQVVMLDEPIPVHLVYFTVWQDDSGVLQWRPDVYERDPVVLAALDSGDTVEATAGD